MQRKGEFKSTVSAVLGWTKGEGARSCRVYCIWYFVRRRMHVCVHISCRVLAGLAQMQCPDDILISLYILRFSSPPLPS